MTKAEELSNPNSCLNRSEDDEPLFVLCARDRLAPFVVESWANFASDHGVNQAKIDEARDLARRMLAYQSRRRSKLPD